MFSHVFVGTNDLAAAKRFYDAIFAVTGVGEGYCVPDGPCVYRSETGTFAVSKPINGEPACHANGGTIGFMMKSPEMADAWHAAGVAHGGTSCEDSPGIRETPMGPLYLAYLRDLDGNKLCAFFPMPG